MADDLPYAVEYAKTGRASCKGCKTPIPQASLRIAVMVQSAFHDGKQPNWFHNDCFFKKQRPQSVGDFGNYENIRYEDQKALREKIENSAGAVLPTKGKGKKRSKEESAALKDFGIEYAKSSRSACRGCELKITKNEVRIKKVVFDTEVGMKYGGQPFWHHIDCFVQVRNELGWFESGEKLPGFNSLKKEDKDKVKKSIPAMKAEDIPEPKKAKLEPKDEKDLEEEKKLEALIEMQTKEFFKYRDNLEQEMNKTDVIALLHKNHQTPPVGDKAKMYDLAADILTFGALAPCEECSGGQIVFNKSGYICTGDLTEWVKCTKFVKEPKRVPCKIPTDLKEAYSFLKKYKGKVQNRAVRYIAPSAQALAMTGKVKKEDQLDGPRVKKEKPPLYNCEVAVALKSDEEESVNKRLTALGAKIIKTVHSKTLMVITNEQFFEKYPSNSKIKRAKSFGIHVVPVEYLDAVEGDPAGVVSYITSKTICDWGTDPTARFPAEEEKSAKSKSIYTKSVPKSQKVILKDGIAVDPDSGLHGISHVYVKGSTKYSAVLGLTDVQSNKNKYYKLQVLESDGNNRYWVFRSWGRIGTTIGGTKCDNCSTLSQAIKIFEQHYLEKSGNPFSVHNTSNFVKRPGLMYPIDIDYGEEKIVDLKQEHKVKSKLLPPVQELVKLIFDIDQMRRVMKEFHLDMEKMPLGKLSKKQLQNAYKVLSEISELIEKGGSNAKFIDATNRFYTLVPQNFGVDSPPLLDTKEQVNNLTDMLDSLMEIECAYSMLKEEKEDVKTVDEEVNPIDTHYEQLKTKLVPIDKNSDEFQTLEKYVQNTHAETHRTYELEIVDIFKVERSGEARRFKPFKKLHNRKLLWHGSRTTNFAGILSHGLKIAPPEAPVTGYMFGKGIYFADMVSKSANYCFTSHDNNAGLLLLSEVALGDMYERLGADYITQLPKDKHSTKGVGRTQPDPKESIFREDGVEIPLGKPYQDSKISSSLLYNEYIVYDVAQVNIQYLLRMNFNYKYGFF